MHASHVRRGKINVKSEVAWTLSAERSVGISQRVEVGDQIVELLLGEAAAGGGHHVAPVENGLPHEAFVGGQSARQKRFLEEALQDGPVLPGNGMRVVARCAGLLINVAAGRLLRVQLQLRVGF